MSKPNRNAAAHKTLASATIDSLMTPQLEPGKAYLIVIKGRSVGRMVELTDEPAVIGRAADCELPVDDEAVSREHAQVSLVGGEYVVTDLGSTNGLFVDNARVERHTLSDGNRVQIGTSTILKFCFQDELEESFQRQLYESATRDPLVGTYNRQYFLDALDAELSLSLRSGIPLSLLMIDIDHFKSVNDRWGHLVGDQALKQVAAVIQGVLRAEDVLARYGGEEFSVMLRHTSGVKAFKAAERIRKSVEAYTVEAAKDRFQVTLSIGIGTLEAGNRTAETLLGEADRYLYEAKQTGRNRCVSADPPSSPKVTTALPSLRSPEERTEETVTTAALQALDTETVAAPPPAPPAVKAARKPRKKAARPGGKNVKRKTPVGKRKVSRARKPRATG